MNGDYLEQLLALNAKTGELTGYRASACGRCSAAEGCGLKLVTSRETPLRLPLPAELANSGREYIVARFPARTLLGFCLLVFPLLAIVTLVGAVAGSTALPVAGDLGALGGALGGLALGAAALKLYDAASGGCELRSQLEYLPAGQDVPTAD